MQSNQTAKVVSDNSTYRFCFTYTGYFQSESGRLLVVSYCLMALLSLSFYRTRSRGLRVQKTDSDTVDSILPSA